MHEYFRLTFTESYYVVILHNFCKLHNNSGYKGHNFSRTIKRKGFIAHELHRIIK